MRRTHALIEHYVVKIDVGGRFGHYPLDVLGEHDQVVHDLLGALEFPSASRATSGHRRVPVREGHLKFQPPTDS